MKTFVIEDGFVYAAGEPREPFFVQPRTSSQPTFKDLTKKRVGRLVVTGRSNPPNAVNGAAMWDAQCDCGNIKTNIYGAALNKERTRSCGCLKAEVNAKRNRARAAAKLAAGKQT